MGTLAPAQRSLLDLAAEIDAAEARAAEEAAKQRGMDAASGHEDARWNAYAAAKLRAVALAKPYVHVDDLYAVCAWQPRNPNAWGSIWSAAQRGADRYLAITDRTRPTNLPGKHRHRYPIYASLIYQGDQGARAA